MEEEESRYQSSHDNSQNVNQKDHVAEHHMHLIQSV